MLKEHTNTSIESATRKCNEALEKFMRVVIRMSIKVGINYPTFQSLCQRLFVEVAHEEFAPTNGKATVARTALISGISRKTVRSQLIESGSAKQSAPSNNMISGWLLSAWRNRDDCIGADGSPRILSFDKGEPSISSLVRDIYDDFDPNEILQDLIRFESVEKTGVDAYRLTGKLHFTEGIYEVYEKGLKSHLFWHAETIERNMQKNEFAARQSVDGRLERVAYDFFPADSLGTARRVTRERSEDFLQSMDDVLTVMSRSHSINQKSQSEGLTRCGIGLYYWESGDSG